MLNAVKLKNHLDKTKIQMELFSGPSHQVIHPHLLHPSLPQPEMEEEVVAIPALDVGNLDPNCKKHKLKKDAPHLIFEITSNDGFHIQSDSWYGE